MAQKNVIETVLRFEADIKEISTAAAEIRKKFGDIKPNTGFEKAFLNTLSSLENEIENFSTKASRGISSMADSRALGKSAHDITELFDSLKNQVASLAKLSDKEMAKLFPASVVNNLGQASKALGAFGVQQKNANKVLKEKQAQLDSYKKKLEAIQNAIEGVGAAEAVLSEEDYAKKRKDLTTARRGLTTNRNKLEAHEKGTNVLSDEDFKKASDKVALFTARVEKLERELAATDIKKYTTQIEALGKEIGELQSGGGQNFNQLKDTLKNLVNIDISDLEGVDDAVEQITRRLEELPEEELEKVKQIIGDLRGKTEEVVPALQKMQLGTEEAKKEFEDLAEAEKSLNQLKSNLLQFFSIGNAVQLFKRAVSSAIDTVKELDAAMTEIAVVSDYDISDMWDTLPQFTDTANKLGVSIKDMYSATTLYIQQGLDMNASLELATETMKMARIAGLDAAQATDAMTAALRGFNMELNETSAQNVSDVYSKLAAITASDVEEISTAMTKTASIAHSANMEFETTAAFLSQIIETTRESAETAGTAMKTVIARFQELKKDPSEIGEVDGEIIDANKIETALRTIGVSLRDTSGQFRDLDDVFLEIAQRWDSLDTNTQRYIATMAAGSRQQSRFIAMMSNYERTMDLVGAANNSAGASQEQFEKTLESLDAQLERLSNAWAEFTMGLANNEVIKFGVKLLADLLETINKLSSGAGDLGEAVIKLGLSFAALKGGGALLKNLFTGDTLKVLLSGTNKAGEKIGFAFGKSFVEKLNSSKELSQGINKEFFENLFKNSEKNINFIGDLFENYSENDLNLDNIKGALQNGLNNMELDSDNKLKIGNLINNGDIDNLKAANNELSKLGFNIEASADMTTEGAKQINNDINMTSVALTAAAAAIGGVFMVIGDSLEKQGHEKIGKIIKGLGQGLMSFATIMSVVIPLHAQMMAAGVGTAIKSIPVIGWILAIASALVSIGMAIAEIHETAEEKSERLEKQAKTMQAAAEATKEAYEGLLDSFEEYDNLQKTLDGLVKGTDEWRKALLASNEVVLQLLNNYPSLAKYITTNESGQLVISEVGKQVFVDQQQEAVEKTRQMAIGSEIAKALGNLDTKKEEVKSDNKDLIRDYSAREKINNKYAENPGQFLTPPTQISGKQIAEWWESGDEKLRSRAERAWKQAQDQGVVGYEELSFAYNWGFDNLKDETENITFYSDAIHELAQESGESAEAVYDMVENLKELSNQEVDIEFQLEGLVSGALNLGASDELLGDEFAGKIQEAFANSIDVDGYLTKLEEGKTELEGESFEKATPDDLQEEYLEVTGLKTLPKEIANLSKEQLLEELASEKVLKDLSDSMNEFYKSLSDRSAAQKDYAIRAIQKDGKGFTKAMANAYKDFYKEGKDGKLEVTDIDKLKSWFTDNTGLDFDTVAKQMGLSADEFAQYLVENAQKTEGAYVKAREKLSFIDPETITSLEDSGVSAESLGKLGEMLTQVMYTSGTEAANTIAANFDKLLAGRTPADVEKITNAFNNLDTTTPDGVRAFSEAVKSLDLEVPLSEAALNSLEEQIISLGNISEKISFEQLEEKLKSLKQLMDSIEDREDNYTFSDEEKQQLTDSGISADDFIYSDIDEWIYTGGTLESLLEDIRANTSDILSEMMGSLEYEVERGVVWESAFEEGLTIKSTMTGAYHEVETPVTITPEELNKLVSSEIDETDPNYTLERLRGIVEALGLNVQRDGTVSDTSKLSREQLLGLIQRDYNENYGLFGGVYQTKAETAEREEQKQVEQSFANASVEELINTQSLKYAELINDALIAQARKYKVDETLIKDFLKATNQGTTAATKRDKVLLGNAINAKKAQQSYAEVSEEITKITEKYDDLEKQIINEDVRKIGEALGLDELGEGKSGFEFVKENLETIDKAFQGDVESAQELQRLLVEEIGGQEYGVDFNIDGDFSLLMSKFDTLPSEIKDRLTELQKLGLFKVETVQLKGTTVQYEVDEQERMVARTVPYYYSAEVLVPADAEDIKQGSGNFSGVVETGTKKTAENKYDKHYNLMQVLNAELRVRERLQREYNALLEDGTVSGQELYEAAQAQIASLERQKEIQQQLLELRKQDREELLSSNSKFSKYAWYNENDNTIEIDWGELEALAKKDPDKYDEVSDYISELEDTQEKIGDIEDALNDIEDDVEKLRYEGETDYINIEGRILDALIEKQNKIIEQQQEINESINEAAADLVGAIQDNISKLRQDRQNEDTEASLAEKERRLAYLRQDTSGANAMEIKRLEEEIAKERESYGDSLVDQALQDLQSQNDEAAEQRERQITLMQEHLEWQKETGYYAAEAHRIFEDTLQNGGLFDTNSEFYQLITSTEGWGALAHSDQMQKLEEIRKALVAAYNYMMNKKEDEVPVDYETTDYLAIINDATQRFLRGELDFNDALRIIQEAEKLRDLKINTKDANGVTYGDRYNVSPTNGSLAGDFSSNYGQYVGGYYDGGSANTGATTPNETEEGPMHSLPEVVKSTDTANIKKLQEGLNSMKAAGKIADFGADLAVDGKYGPKTQAAVKALQFILGVKQDGWWGKVTYAAFMARADLKQFKTGGLADFTGPAWLDGTKSRPEMVLNARDTENFIVLKDVLSSLLHLPQTDSMHGDNYFDIDVQVEEISDDYDVDQVIERVKEKIYEDSMYRNNNSISLKR